MKKIKTLLCFLLFFAQDALATHIVGGEITYRCLGGQQYEVSLTVFRDCDTGIPWFDSPASLGVFDINNNLVYAFDLLLDPNINDTLDLVLFDPCLFIPPNACINRTTYTRVISLPFRVGGYQLVYQRCCRNQDIVNIVLPEATGATYYTYISEQALLGCNNSITFNNWPPVFICLGSRITFDHSATDIDGDVIVYEMCSPLRGASEDDPQPQPPLNPPYLPVIWSNGGGYSESNMMGNAADPLSIDPQTGLLTGTPVALGTYVVGVCASEYRNGVLISTTRRDFQYVVGICGAVTRADFYTPEFPCDNQSLIYCKNNDLTVSFVNQSEATTPYLNFFWNFDTNDSTAISTAENPTYTYPDTGYYTIMLIANPDSPCIDTTFCSIYVQRTAVEVQSIPVELICKGDTVVLKALCPNDVGENITYQWVPGIGALNGTTDDSLVVFANQDAQYYVVVENEYRCRDSAFTAINISSLTPPLDIVAQPDSVYEGNSTQLTATQNPDYTYLWQQDSTLSDSTIFNPIASPIIPTTYYLSITNGICYNADSVTVYIIPPVCGNPLVFMPNAFTPNGDNLNDILYVRGINITELYLAIYNRWGQRVFETNDQNIGWDGTFKGLPLPPDVYGYYFQCQCEEGQSYFEKGNVSIIR